MKTITIDGVEYNLTPIKKTEAIILEQHLKFEVYPEDLGKHNWESTKKVCENLGDGWRLPTKEELHLMWLNRDNIGGFTNSSYWSSSERTTNLTWYQIFRNGSQDYIFKYYTYYVRPVRDVTI